MSAAALCPGGIGTVNIFFLILHLGTAPTGGGGAMFAFSELRSALHLRFINISKLAYVLVVARVNLCVYNYIYTYVENPVHISRYKDAKPDVPCSQTGDQMVPT